MDLSGLPLILFSTINPVIFAGCKVFQECMYHVITGMPTWTLPFSFHRQVWGCQGDSNCHTERVCGWHFTVDSGSECCMVIRYDWTNVVALKMWCKFHGLPANQSAMDTLFLWESVFWHAWVINNQLTNTLLEFILFANWQMPISLQKITPTSTTT